jgi:hypothetical protein
MSSPEQARQFHNLMIALAAFALVAYLEVAIFYWWHPLLIGHDQALHVECAKLMLNGALPYVGFTETNPPLIFYLDAIPASLSTWLTLPPPLVFSESVVLLSLLSFVLAFAVTRRFLDWPEFSSAAAMLIALPLLSLFFRFDFGQREHIFMLFYSPFILVRWLRWHGQNPGSIKSALAGGAAAIGICLKPFFIIPALAIELFWLIDSRKMRPFLAPEMVALVGALLAYLLHFLLLPSASQKAFFDFVLPVLKEGYGFYDVSTIAQIGLTNFKQLFVGGTFVCFLALLLRNRSSLLLPLAVFTVASLPVYLIQNKGWPYHAMPFFAGLLYLTFVEVWLILDECGRIWNGYQVKTGALICSIILFGFYFQQETASYLCETKMPLELLGWKGNSPIGDLSALNLCKTVMDNSDPGDRILFFSNGPWPEFPMTLQLNRQPGSRHLHASFLSILEFIRLLPENNERNNLLKYENQIIAEYATDISANKPKLVFVQISPIEEYLRPYDFENKYLSKYKRIDDVEGFRVYTRRGS